MTKDTMREETKQPGGMADALPSMAASEDRNTSSARDAAVVEEAFSGLDNDLVDLDRVQDSDRGDDGLGPADEDEDEQGLADEDVDETSAGGLKFPDEP